MFQDPSIFHEILSESKIYSHLTVLNLIPNEVVFKCEVLVSMDAGGLQWSGGMVKQTNILLAYHFRPWDPPKYHFQNALQHLKNRFPF